MNKKISVLSIVIGLIVFLRIVFEESEKLLYIVAGINIVAIVFVLYTIVEKTVNGIIRKIEKSNVPGQISEREVAYVKRRVWRWSAVAIIVFVLLYLWKGCSGLGNDIISIVALGVSVMDDEIAEMITKNYKE